VVDLGLKDKVALVTGGSRGIGRSIAHELAREGCRVALCARGEDRLRATAGELSQLGAEPLGLVADLMTDVGRENVVTQTVAHFGGLDILVNNVGGGGAASFAETTDELWNSAFDLTFWPSLKISRLAIPHLQQRGGGSIIMIGSVYGREMGGRAAYQTVKSAQLSLAKAMARELAPLNIRVNTVAPGSIRFPGGSWDRRCLENPEAMEQFVKAEMPLGRFGRPEEVANVVVFLASERASLMTGACVNVDGCQSRSLI
jgi:3-oxoacyl-[acyl-carrier protein] reductase